MRARNVKPSLFKNELLATSDPLNTWIFEGLWCIADREGRLEDRPRRIHLEINPGRAYEGTEAALTWLAEQGFILRYKHSSGEYIQIINFGKHQNPHMREPASVIPEPGVSTGQAPDIRPNIHSTKSEASTVPAPGQHETGPALSPFPLPDSPSLIPPSPIHGTEEPSRVRTKHIEGIFAHWQSVHGHPTAKLDPKRRTAITKALKAYTYEQLRECVDGYKLLPHNMGQNPNGTVYDDIELMVRDAAHVERGLNALRGSANGGGIKHSRPAAELIAEAQARGEDIWAVGR